jgi:hypothetical protein
MSANRVQPPNPASADRKRVGFALSSCWRLIILLADFKTESLVHDHKYRGAPKDGRRGKEETFMIDLKEASCWLRIGIVLARKYFTPILKGRKHFEKKLGEIQSVKEQKAKSWKK